MKNFPRSPRDFKSFFFISKVNFLLKWRDSHFFLVGKFKYYFEIVGFLQNLPVGFQKLSNRLDFHFPNVKCVMGEKVSVFFGDLLNFGQT